MRYFLVCLVFILLILSVLPVQTRAINELPKVTAGQVNEALNNLTPVRFLPNNPLYFLIRGKEIISRFFQPSFRDRAQFDYTISSKRLKEAYLLTNRGDLRKTKRELSSYITSLGKIEGQLEKARSQNQDITVIVERISDNLRFQEILLSELSNYKGQNQDEFIDKLEESVSSFGNFVLYLDKIKPGVRDRFQLFITKEFELKTVEVNVPIPIVSPSPTSESSSQAKPRRVIF